MDMLELATKLEGMSEPDREVDAEIAIALGHKIKMAMANYTMEMFPAIEWQKPHPYAGMKEPCPAWTASIDEARKLVPKGYAVELSEAWGPDRTDWTAVLKLRTVDGTGKWPKARSDSPAIALCGAALKARASTVLE